MVQGRTAVFTPHPRLILVPDTGKAPSGAFSIFSLARTFYKRAFSITTFTNTYKKTRAPLFNEEGRRLFFNAEEREAFITAAATAPDTTQTFCSLLHYTGCNFTEALKFTAGQVDFSGRAIRFQRPIRGVYAYDRAVPSPIPSSPCSSGA